GALAASAGSPRVDFGGGGLLSQREAGGPTLEGFDNRQRPGHAGKGLRGARPAPVVARPAFGQFGVRQDGSQLVVQAVKKETELRRFIHRAANQELESARRQLTRAGAHRGTSAASGGLISAFRLPDRLDGWPVGVVRVAPERVH